MSGGTPRLKHFYESQQLTPQLIQELFKDAKRYEQMLARGEQSDLLKGKKLVVLFFEPSTRTKFSFEIAMANLGGQCIGTENAGTFSSFAKKESAEDFIRVVGGYGGAAAVVVRSIEEGMAARMAAQSRIPVINAGDGKGQHPTQALLDLFTINEELGRTHDFKIAFVGDLANGRTVRSLAYLLAKYPNVEMFFVSPDSLRVKPDIKEYLERHGVAFHEGSLLDAVLPEIDVVYMTRLQTERGMTEEEIALAKKQHLAIDQSNLHLIRPEARILHPLPKVDEINLPLEVENTDPRVAYFRQAWRGVPVRMAILAHVITPNGSRSAEEQ